MIFSSQEIPVLRILGMFISDPDFFTFPDPTATTKEEGEK
jgi:hypothetical protein